VQFRRGGAWKGRWAGRFAESSTIKKKEEFPGFMENMLPRNSFPQICVVSIHIMPKIIFL
jgi:hypothetical protein